MVRKAAAKPASSRASKKSPKPASSRASVKSPELSVSQEPEADAAQTHTDKNEEGDFKGLEKLLGSLSEDKPLAPDYIRGLAAEMSRVPSQLHPSTDMLKKINKLVRHRQIVQLSEAVKEPKGCELEKIVICLATEAIAENGAVKTRSKIDQNTKNNLLQGISTARLTFTQHPEMIGNVVATVIKSSVGVISGNELEYETAWEIDSKNWSERFNTAIAQAELIYQLKIEQQSSSSSSRPGPHGKGGKGKGKGGKNGGKNDGKKKYCFKFLQGKCMIKLNSTMSINTLKLNVK